MMNVGVRKLTHNLRTHTNPTYAVKRSMASGYAGVGNPLFVMDNTRMLFGDANVTMQAVLKALRG